MYYNAPCNYFLYIVSWEIEDQKLYCRLLNHAMPYLLMNKIYHVYQLENVFPKMKFCPALDLCLTCLFLGRNISSPMFIPDFQHYR